MGGSVISEYLDLASEQGWRAERTRDGGWKLFPQKGKCQPGYEIVCITEPRGNLRALDEIRCRLRRAGLKFTNEELKLRNPAPMSTASAPKQNGQAMATTVTVTPYAAIRQKINDAISRLSDIEQLVGELEKDASKIQAFKELFK